MLPSFKALLLHSTAAAPLLLPTAITPCLLLQMQRARCLWKEDFEALLSSKGRAQIRLQLTATPLQSRQIQLRVGRSTSPPSPPSPPTYTHSNTTTKHPTPSSNVFSSSCSSNHISSYKNTLILLLTSHTQHTPKKILSPPQKTSNPNSHPLSLVGDLDGASFIHSARMNFVHPAVHPQGFANSLAY